MTLNEEAKRAADTEPAPLPSPETSSPEDPAASLPPTPLSDASTTTTDSPAVDAEPPAGEAQGEATVLPGAAPAPEAATTPQDATTLEEPAPAEKEPTAEDVACDEAALAADEAPPAATAAPTGLAAETPAAVETKPGAKTDLTAETSQATGGEPSMAETTPDEAVAGAESPSQEAAPKGASAEPSDDAGAAEAVEVAGAAEAEADSANASAVVTVEFHESANDGAEMAAALSESTPGVTVKPGQRVKVKLVQIAEGDCFVDYGGRSEGRIASSELKGKDGTIAWKPGEERELVVKAVGDTVVFTLGRKSGRSLRLKELQQAFEAGVPVQGVVRKTNKGGFDIGLRGARAFCPFSQIELGYCEDPERYVGKKFPFTILTFERGGRNIVVSRRKLLQEEANRSAEKTRERLEPGEVFEGTVRRLQPYGAFVDIGGLDGLVHVSEISRGHIHDPKDVLKVGDRVKVKVLRIDGLGTDKERISLSMKELEPDPWEQAAEKLVVGEKATGKVVRLTDFGAFVEILPGVDGLIHVSELAQRRVGHPNEILSEGQEVEAQILRVDLSQRRISLSLRALASPEELLAEAGQEDPTPSSPSPPRGGEPRRKRRTRKEAAAEVEEGMGAMSYEEKLEALKRKFARKE